MGLFKKRNKVLDWSEGYRVSNRKTSVKTNSSDDNSDNSALGFLGTIAENSNSSSDNLSWDNDSSLSNSSNAGESVGEYQEKKQKLARRFVDMTNRIEDLSNQVYHLKQRIELLEKKMRVSYD